MGQPGRFREATAGLSTPAISPDCLSEISPTDGSANPRMTGCKRSVGSRCYRCAQWSFHRSANCSLPPPPLDKRNSIFKSGQSAPAVSPDCPSERSPTDFSVIPRITGGKKSVGSRCYPWAQWSFHRSSNCSLPPLPLDKRNSKFKSGRVPADNKTLLTENGHRSTNLANWAAVSKCPRAIPLIDRTRSR